MGLYRHLCAGHDAETHPFLDRLTDYALAYYRDFVAPNKTYRAASEAEKNALDDLLARLEALPHDADGETIQTEVYATGMAHLKKICAAGFKCFMKFFLGQSQGPRFGSFAALYGLEKTCALIAAGRDGKLLSA